MATSFLTALIASANFNGQPIVMTIIPFPSRQTCEAAMEPMYDIMHGTFPDVVIQCVDSHALAESETPKWRTE